MGSRRSLHPRRSSLKVAVLKQDGWHSWLLLVVLFLLLAVSIQSRSEEPLVGSCECPKLHCEPCYEEQGVTFYSEKCGPNQSRVKSCARPTCVLMDPQPAQCAAVSKSAPEVLPTENPVRSLASTIDLPTSKTMMDSRLAELKTELRGAEIGTIETAIGTSHVVVPSGEEHTIRSGLRVHEKAQIKTSLRGHVKIRFDDGNEVHVKPNSQVVVQEYLLGKEKKVILDLIKGKVRSKVKEKYEGNENSYYKVKTKSAVAGVRGTDFVVEHLENERTITKVSTFEGVVDFGPQHSKDEPAQIKVGEQGSFIIAGVMPDNSVFSDQEIKDFGAKGYMMPVYSLTAAEIKELQDLTEVAQGDPRVLAKAVSKSVCGEPKADINQCMWTCVNNPKGEKRCRTDLPQVNCVRKKCDANGHWSDESRLPASFHEMCQPTGYHVGSCDY